MNRILFTAIVLLLSSSAITFAQSASPAPPAGAALTPEVLELRRAGNAALYNIDYETARQKF